MTLVDTDYTGTQRDIENIYVNVLQLNPSCITLQAHLCLSLDVFAIDIVKIWIMTHNPNFYLFVCMTDWKPEMTADGLLVYIKDNDLSNKYLSLNSAVF